MVAGAVSQRVVALLEPVEVDEQHGHPTLCCLGVDQRTGQQSVRLRPVGQAGQCVVRGLVFELALKLLPFTDGLDDPLHRPVHRSTEGAGCRSLQLD